MGTPAERRALIFLAILIALGGGVRLVKAAAEPDPGVDAQLALRRQIIAVDSARAARQAGAARRPAKASRPAAPAAPPVTRTASGRVGAAAAGGAGSARSAKGTRRAAPDAPPLVDVDIASAEELNALPGIGPAIAARIVEDRARHGQYGSLRELQRVKGVGPATVARLAPHVTFSGNPRPPSAVSGGWPGVSGGSRP